MSVCASSEGNTAFLSNTAYGKVCLAMLQMLQ